MGLTALLCATALLSTVRHGRGEGVPRWRPVILGLQGAIQAPGLVLAGLCGEGQARPEVAQQLIASQHNPPALLLQGLCQVCHWGYANHTALLVYRDCGVLSMQVLQYLSLHQSKTIAIAAK